MPCDGNFSSVLFFLAILKFSGMCYLVLVTLDRHYTLATECKWKMGHFNTSRCIILPWKGLIIRWSIMKIKLLKDC
jgi:hypothetical protein